MHGAKRAFDVAASLAGVILASPLFAGVALAVKADSPGPVFFRQERVGLGGRRFRIWKFRTMYVQQPAGSRRITVGADPRITSVGAFVRRYKLDELPQLFNVIAGDMSLVGPRPELPEYVESYPPRTREIVLSVRPGITDSASVEYRDESEILARAEDPEREYRDVVLPHKLALAERYVQSWSLWLDIRLIFATLAVLAKAKH